jgi:hypothetical protein
MTGADMARLPDWEARLAAHVTASRDVTYRLGRRDCARFAAGGVMAVTGVDIWPADLDGYSTHRGLVRALRRKGWQSLDDAATALLGPFIPPLAAHSGDVVSDGSALGVMTPGGPVALSEGGFVDMARGSLLCAWPVGRANG